MNIYLKAALIAVGSVGGGCLSIWTIWSAVKAFGGGKGAFFLTLLFIISTGSIFAGAVDHLKRMERLHPRPSKDERNAS